MGGWWSLGWFLKRVKMVAITDIKKLNTMHSEYGDGSDHLCCTECGFCKKCGDCNKFGCGAEQS